MVVRLAIVVVAALAVLGLTQARGEPERASVSAPERPTGPRETCATRSMAEFPGAFTSRANLVVGPLVLIGGGTYTTPETVHEFGGNKFPLLVKAGHRVTVELNSPTASLGYGPRPEGEVEVEDGHRSVRFIACRRHEASGSDADGDPVTFWSGFLLTDTPQCVRLRVWVDREPRPRTARVALGKRCR